jgi:glutamine kinase
MKLIILAAGNKLTRLDDRNNIPKSLLKYDKDETILEHQIKTFSNFGITNPIIVGGYGILRIMEAFPSLKYYYNKNWETTKSLYSLYCALDEFNDDLIVSYADVVYDASSIKNLLELENDVSIIYDSAWKNRYEGRSQTFQDEAEKVFCNSKEQIEISKSGSRSDPFGEFVGVAYFSRKSLETAKRILKRSIVNQSSTIPDLITAMGKKFDVGITDLKGKWAELDSPQDLVQFKFGTKAENLFKLERQIEGGIILPQIRFTVRDFRDSRISIIQNIKEEFQDSELIVRSSALNEDTETQSLAGNYQSVLNVKPDRVDEAIEEVIASYYKNTVEIDNENQILVQPQLQSVSHSGVIFTRDIETGSPYYIINYDISDKTDTITSGNSCENIRTFIYYKYSTETPPETWMHNLISVSKEIEKLTNHDSLDIEFAIVNNKVYILQIRPIAVHKDAIKVFDKDIQAELKSIKRFFTDNQTVIPKLVGKKTAYGVMPDWNPAEIIGINPFPLAFDLYKYIITDDVWARSREVVGYRKINFHPGIFSFGGKPYVDIRMSSNTFTPTDIRDSLAGKLTDYCIDKLKKLPENHDKVEFNIFMTAYSFDFNDRLNELLANGFDEEEITIIRNSFLTLTNDIINEKNIKIKDELQKAKSLNKKRREIQSSDISIEFKIIKILEDCKEFGTLPFSILARFGFVGAILMKSLVKKNVISQNDLDLFMGSIKTIAKDFIIDLSELRANTVTQDNFLDKYGHLRPGSYDINSMTYKENFDNYIQIDKVTPDTSDENSAFHFPEDTLVQITQAINDNGLQFDVDALLSFTRRATEARELAKFEFTKNLSLALDLIKELAAQFGINRENAAFLNLNDIMSMSYGSVTSNITNELIDSIHYNKKKHLIATAIKLPPVIFDDKDFDYFFLLDSEPNFVTQNNIVGEVVYIEEGNENINDKIVLIKNADPGFDWIFSHNIKGLVTQYGGAASHMTIRCAEFGLPAAIGCGDSIFDQITKAKNIQLDCLNKNIKIIQ